MTTHDLPTRRLHDVMMQWRHDLHAHPELGFAVQRTAAKVAGLLRDFGLEVHEGIGGSGVVGVLRKGRGSRSIGIRADMDALPIEEKSNLVYRSRHAGQMHACGHDGHTTMALGAARYLAEDGLFDGTAVFIFQPDEENGRGAPAMLQGGLFERFPVDEVYAIHNLPGMPIGSFATCPGSITASESLFEIEIEGRGGHAAMPHTGVDAIVVGAAIVQALQTIVSRKLDPGLSGVVSVTEFITDGRRNVLPGRATLKGDARASTPAVRDTIEARMRQLVDGLCRAHDVSATVSFVTEFPSVINASAQVDAVVAAARAVTDATLVDARCTPRLFSEDFAHMASARPGCFVLMGNGDAGAYSRPLHSAEYDFNDQALALGAAFWARLVEDRLVPASLSPTDS